MSADAAIVQVATWTAIAATGYLLVRGCADVLHARPGAAKGALGLALVGCLAGGGVALAASGDGHAPRPAVSVGWPVSAHERSARSVVVRRGDSLWTIAADRLTRPTAVHIANAWPRWWHTNRRVLGPDPNLIRPGQQLRPPVHLRSRS